MAAESHLNACGYMLPQPEGWGHFFGKRSGRSYVAGSSASTDGHMSPATKRMKDAEDDSFQFVFTWVEGGRTHSV